MYNDSIDFRIAHQEIQAAELYEYVIENGLNEALECEMDAYVDKKLGPVVSLYCRFVDIAVTNGELGSLVFSIKHPADDADKCQDGVPAGFSVSQKDFETKVVAEKVQALVDEAMVVYKKLGIDPAEYYEDIE